VTIASKQLELPHISEILATVTRLRSYVQLFIVFNKILSIASYSGDSIVEEARLGSGMMQMINDSKTEHQSLIEYQFVIETETRS